MRKLNLADYMAKIKISDPENPMEEIKEVEFPYHVRDSILNLMFSPQLQLSNAEVVKQNVLAIKLEQCNDGEVLLEDEEYDRIKKAFDIFRGFGRPDVELVKRINEAPVAEVEEIKPKEG
ncbi:hypothetical protein ES703_111107 [subsurface metagenome]